MPWMVLRILLAMVLLSVAPTACSAPRSERCKNICEREAECAETIADKDFRFDQRECVAACTALEHDDDGRGIVEKHADCVERAGTDCAKVYECQ